MIDPYRLLASAALLALAAPAQGIAAETDVERIQARLDTATRLQKSGLHADALQVLEEAAAELGADGEAQFPLLRFMMARCLIELDRPEDARAALARFEVLARDEQEKALAAEWIATVKARAYGALAVECPEGGTARIEGQAAIEPQPCPATFDDVRAGAYSVAVDGLEGPLVGEAEVVAGDAVTVVPAPPPPDAPWLWGGIALSGGAGLTSGPVPDGIEPGAGAHLSVEVLGEVAVFDGFRVRLGVGFDHAHLAFDDSALDLSGAWVRGSLLVPLDLRVELPWSLALTVGGGLDVLLFGEEARDDRTTELAEIMTPLGGVARVGLERAIYADGLDVRVALRFQRWLTPIFEDLDPTMQTLDLGVIVLL